MDSLIRLPLSNGPTQLHVASRKKQAPVLLFVHGGPGNPNRHKIFRHLKGLKTSFIVAAYDQYGCGDSAHPKNLSVDMLVDQIIEVGIYLKETYVSPVILIGESFGSYLSILALQKEPTLFSAYVGYGQTFDEPEMLQSRMDLFLEKLKIEGAYSRIEYWNKNKEKLFAAKKGSAWEIRFLSEYYPLMEKGIPSFYRREIMPFQRSKEYSRKAKERQMKDSTSCQKKLLSAPFYLPRPLTIDVPVYILAGEQDVTTTFAAQKKAFDAIIAKEKHFIPMEGLGHMLPFENPAKFIELINSFFIQ
ncbi:MAG: alpha/beta hydrolase [Candidatus Enteromonas sp.]|nr:alpha/beta hydrolase [Candidatus Enteromonas sp.]